MVLSQYRYKRLTICPPRLQLPAPACPDFSGIFRGFFGEGLMVLSLQLEFKTIFDKWYHCKIVTND